MFLKYLLLVTIVIIVIINYNPYFQTIYFTNNISIESK